MLLPKISSIWNWNQAVASAGALAMAFVLASLAIGYAVFTTYYYYVLRKDGRKYPPYAPGGALKHLRNRINSKNPNQWSMNISKELQSRVFRIPIPRFPSTSLYIVGDLTAFRALLTDPNTIKPPKLYGHFRGLYGGEATVFTSNPGAGWHSKRKAVAPAFSSTHIRRMTRVALDKTEAWIENVLKERDSFDVSKEMIGIVLSALSETALEYEMSEQEKKLFSQELRLVLIEFTRMTPLIPFRNLFGWLVPKRRRALVAAKRLKALVIKIMHEYKKKEHYSRTNGTIIQLIMESDAFPTDDEKAAQLLEFLVAGHDTTAYSIAFTLIELAKHPEEQKKLRESLSQLSPINWSRSQQLQWVIKEGMRLHPVARSLRKAGSDIYTSKKELIPKGSLCVAHFMMLFRNPDIFNESESFIPGRWQNPTQDMMDAVNPFSLGKQNCVGQSLARAETSGIIARIVSEFELSIETEGEVVFFLTLKPEGARLRTRRL